jgi:hypothetical protein
VQKLAIAAALAAAALTLTACSDDGSKSKTDAKSPSANPSSQAIAITPDGETWDRTQAVNEAKQMAKDEKGSGSPTGAKVCETFYTGGLQNGGKFPAGKQAWIDACQEGVRQAG